MSLGLFFKNRKASSVILLGTSAASLASVSSNQKVCAEGEELLIGTVAFFTLIFVCGELAGDGDTGIKCALTIILTVVSLYGVAEFLGYIGNCIAQSRQEKEKFIMYRRRP